MGFLTTKQVADRLGVSIRRVQALVTNGRLPAQKIGRDFLIKEKDLRFVEDRRVGRPKTSAKK
jgi:excisionase family DNA binding protein